MIDNHNLAKIIAADLVTNRWVELVIVCNRHANKERFESMRAWQSVIDQIEAKLRMKDEK